MRLLLTLLMVGGLALAAEVEPEKAEKAERWDRNVDLAALAAQHQAIDKYAALIKRYARTDRERALRMRMLESMENAANLEFRIAHGEAHLRKRAVNFAKYHAMLKSVVQTSSTIIQGSPLADDVARIYYVRAQAYGELVQLTNAKKDYELVANKFSKTTWAVRSNLALAGYATDANNHRLAIEYLKRVEEFPDDSHYPFALYRLAWSWYNLNDVPTAVSYLERHITYYKKKKDESPEKTLLQSEKAFLEHSLRDVVAFYFTGFEKNISGFSLAEALPHFRRVESGPELGKMVVLFAKELRTHDLVDELARWQAQILDEESERPEAIEVVMVNVECLYLRRSFDKVVAAADGFKELDRKTKQGMRKSESYPEAQNLILKVATSLQKTIGQTKNKEQSGKLSRTLAGVYESFTAIVEDSDPRLLQIHYNLAETLFSIKEFDPATNEYVWVLKHWQRKATLKRADVSLKAIASRYETLSLKNELPKDLKPAALSEEDTARLKDLDPIVAEWIGWVDDYLDDFGRTPVSFEEFEFESDRILYARGQTRAALKRMLKLVKARPDSRIASAAASLMLDTYVSAKEWQLVLDTSESFLDMPKLGDAAFKKRIEGLPADASFKLLEASYEAKDYPKTLSQVDRFSKKYDKSPRFPDCLFLASRAADQMKDGEKAVHYLTELLTRFPKDAKRSVALLARAGLEDTAFDFDAAARDYTEYLATLDEEKKEGKDRDTIVKRLQFVTWLSKQPRAPECKGIDKDDDYRAECDRYQALDALATGETTYNPSELIKKSLYTIKDNRALWSAVALVMGGKTIGFKDRLSIAQSLAAGFKDLDPLIQFTLMPVLNRNVPEAFATCRKSLPGIAALKTGGNVLARRIELIKHFETAAEKAVALPWARVKIAVLAELAQVYEDFAGELHRLPIPEGLAGEELAAYRKSVNEILDPFRAKGKDLRSQAVELAGEFAVNAAELTGIPGPAERLPASEVTPVDLALLGKVGEKLPDQPLFTKWEESLRSGAWARVGYFFQQIKEKGEAKDALLGLMRAASLATAGATPEALGELESIRSSLGINAKHTLTQVLYTQYAISSAFKKAKPYADELAPPTAPAAAAPAPEKAAEAKP